MNENSTEASSGVAANSITSIVFMLCTGNIYPQAEKDLEFKPEPPVLSPNAARQCGSPDEGTANMLVQQHQHATV